jgi:4-amino-4-deoxy-L-arabinose transferase-like glycosyltransferase
VPLLAAATQLFGINVWLLRLPAAVAAAALVPISAEIVRLLKGSSTAVVMAAVAAAIAPGLAGLTTTLTTSTFEPLAWTACAYFVVRAVIHDDGRAWIWAGVIAGISIEAKYGIAIWVIGLFVGLLLTQSRRALASRSCWYGAAVAAAISAPSLIWQALHGWPFFILILHHHLARTNFTGNPVEFEIGQIIAMNLLIAPLWIAGVVAPFFAEELTAVRFLSIAFIVATAINVAARGKDYYLFAVYPAKPVLPVGTAWVAQTRRVDSALFPPLNCLFTRRGANSGHVRYLPNRRQAVQGRAGRRDPG